MADVMRHGIFRCSPDTTLRAAAKTMALHHAHAIVATDTVDGSPW
jgi:CBS domain-containing protein